MATYSLVHGAWHGGWAWDFVRAELESHGHVVHAPDLPCEDVNAGLDDYAALVPPCDVVVGHSFAGYTIPRVTAAMRVYVCALVPGVPTEFVPGFGDARTRDELERSYYPDWRDAARELQYPTEHATLAQLLRRQARIDDPGAGPVIAPRSLLKGIIQPRVEETLELLRERLKASGAPVEPGAGIVLTGGASQLAGVREVAVRVFDRPVRLGRPRRVPHLADAASGPAFCAAAGVLHRSAFGPREVVSPKALAGAAIRKRCTWN